MRLVFVTSPNLSSEIMLTARYLVFKRAAPPQVMSKAQLPLLTSIMMVVQAFLAAPAGLRAKRSIKDRNQVLLG